MRKARKFMINAIVLTITALILRTAGVWFSVYIAGKIGPEGVGLYQLLMSVYMFCVTTALSGVGLATTRLVAEELAKNCHAGIKSAVKKCIFYGLFFSTSTAVILFFSTPYICNTILGGKILPSTIYALCISLPCISLSSVFCGYFIAVSRVIKSASAHIFDEFLHIIVSIFALSILAPRGLNYACLAIVIGGVVGEFLSCVYLFLLFWMDKRRYNSNSTPPKGITKRLLSISIPVALSSYLRSFLGTCKQIIIPLRLQKGGLERSAAMAQYGLVVGMVMPVIMFPSAFLSALSSLLIPEIAGCFVKGNMDRISHITSRIFKVTLLFSVFIGGILFAFSDELSHIIFKSNACTPFLKIFAPLVVVMYLDDIVDALLKGLNEQLHVVSINIADTAISILLLYSLLPIFGIAGYIFAIIISECVNGYLSITRLIKVSSFQFLFFPWVFIPTIVILASVFFAKTFFSSIFVCIPFSLVCYMLTLYLLGIIKEEDFSL